MKIWFKSTFCNADGCILVAFEGANVLVTDSIDGDEPDAIVFTEQQWNGLLDAIVAVEPRDEYVAVVDSVMARAGVCGDGWDIEYNTQDGEFKALHFDKEEWDVFEAGVRDGQFRSAVSVS